LVSNYTVNYTVNHALACTSLERRGFQHGVNFRPSCVRWAEAMADFC